MGRRTNSQAGKFGISRLRHPKYDPRFLAKRQSSLTSALCNPTWGPSQSLGKVWAMVGFLAYEK